MSALAQFHVMTGGRASGSDRAFDRPEVDAAEQDGAGVASIRQALQTLGIRITPQDGSGLGAGCDGLVLSTAVEDTVPDVQAAHRLGIPILHRSELLARHVKQRRSIAVSGTSGKSTVTAMVFEILRGTGRDPSVITGGELLRLKEAGYLGNAWAGTSDWLVIEADESDGSLIHYEPWAGILLNLQRDHKEPAELARIFEVFRARTRGPFVVGEDSNLDPFRAGAVTFALSRRNGIWADSIELGRETSRFVVHESGDPSCSASFELPLAGMHNVSNALGAIAMAVACGLALPEMIEPLRGFRGVARRFQVVGTARGIEVIDDFAHNAAKIAASLAAARPRGARILAVYQPHGFGPTRFLRHDLVEAFASNLRPSDRLYMPEIFYAGGTATKDISSRDLILEVNARGIPARFSALRKDLVEIIAAEARAGDVVLVMGARDPSLTTFCRQLLGRIGS
jgi:UDP-N-acetylmuramate-alanine ligase